MSDSQLQAAKMRFHQQMRIRCVWALICCIGSHSFLYQAAHGRDAKTQQSGKKAKAPSVPHYGPIDNLQYAANPHHAWTLTEIEAALKKDPNSLELLTDKARADMLDGDYEEATTGFNKVLARDPHYGRVYLLRSEIDIGDKNWNAVYSDLKNAQKYGTPYVSIAATERLAIEYREQRKWAESMPEYDKLIASGLLTKRLLGRITFQRAEIFLRTNRPEEGLAGATEALKLDPDLTIAYMGRARTYSRLNKVKDAIDNYSLAIDSMQNHDRRVTNEQMVEAYKERGQLYARLGKNDLARRDFVSAKQYDRETMHDMLFRTP